MATKRGGGFGGANNELGSSHRSGVAAVLAVHGLIGTLVGGEPGKVPVRICLEADEPTDDIVCEMLDRSTWFVQCKRTVGDAALRSTMRQWAAQPLEPQDRIVLIANRFKGWLRSFYEVPRGQLLDPDAPLSKLRMNAVAKFRLLLDEEAPGQGGDLLSRIMLIEWDVDSVDSNRVDGSAMGLQNGMVAVGAGHAAFGALRAFMQAAATRRLATRDTDWTGAIDAAGIEVFADGVGPPGARAQARSLARREYREILATKLDHLDISALGDSVTEVFAEGASQDIKVEFAVPGEHQPRSAELTSLARINRRFILVGLPGMGKSEAMRQMAASLASDSDAPLPILLNLRSIAPFVHVPADVTLDLLLDGPARTTLAGAQGDLAHALREAVSSGHVVFLLDGLDETFEKRGIVATGVGALLKRLHADCGFILATRSSAVDFTIQLDLPTVELVTPHRLETSLIALVRAIAAETVPAEQRDVFVTEKTAWIHEASDRRKDIWAVPLLATLATLRAARGADPANNPAQLLNGVVDDSVHKWELRHTAGVPPNADPAFRPQMLLEGFAAMGQALNTTASLARTDAVDLVALALKQWELPRPVLQNIASYVVRFWDETVGIFVDVGGELRARSRQFAELGDARAALASPVNIRLAWLDSALDDPGKMNAVGLATSSDIELARQLVLSASSDPDPNRLARAASWVATMVGDWPHVELADYQQVVNVVATAAQANLKLEASDSGGSFVRTLSRRAEEAQDNVDGRGWAFVLALAQMQLPPDLRSERRERIAAYPASPEQSAIACVLLALVEAHEDARKLTTDEVDSLEGVLATQSPSTPRGAERDAAGAIVIRTGKPTIGGLVKVAERAVDFADQLSAEAINGLYRLARKSRMRTYGAISRALQARGYNDPDPLRFPTPSADWVEAFDDLSGLGWLISHFESHYPDRVELQLNEAWRFQSLADFLDLIGWGESSASGHRAARAEPLRAIEPWIRATVAGGDLDGALIGEEARRLRAHPKGDEMGWILQTSRLQSVGTVPERVGLDLAVSLVPTLASSSDWLSEQAMMMLLERGFPSVADASRALTQPMTPESRFNTSLVTLTNSDSQETDVATLLAGDSPRRAAAAFFLQRSHEGELLKQWTAALLDEDATVRERAGAELGAIEAATHWSCPYCGHRNEMAVTSCANCHVTAGESKRAEARR